jgi:hypothetical protein
VSLPYDEAYDERGEPRPHYAELLGALGDPGELAAEACRRLAARGVIGEPGIEGGCFWSYRSI